MQGHDRDADDGEDELQPSQMLAQMLRDRSVVKTPSGVASLMNQRAEIHFPELAVCTREASVSSASYAHSQR